MPVSENDRHFSVVGGFLVGGIRVGVRDSLSILTSRPLVP